MDEGRAPQRDLPLRSGKFPILREDRAPAELIRLGWSPVGPGNFGKEMDRDETRFWEKPPPGPRRRYARKWLWRAENTPYLS
jgi:hypothetical protein